jgi:hypothetical protein
MAVKPSMRTSLSMLLGKIETTRGVDPIPTSAADAFLVGDLDMQLDPTQLERNIFSPSFSPTPTGVGRKVVNVTFSAELKGSGDVGTTRPKLGALLRSCGMRELLVTAGAASQIEAPIKFGVTSGAIPVWAKSTAPTAKFGSYLVSCVVGGASATAELMVSRWGAGEVDATVLPNTRNDARVNHSSGTTLTLDATDLTSLEFTVAGTPAETDDLYAVIGGVTFYYTVSAANAASGTADDDIATALAALIGADARLTASATGAVITVTHDIAAAPVVVTSGTTEIILGASLAGITPTFAGNLVKGQQWIVQLYEEGYTYRPTSQAALTESMTFYVFKDGVLHIVTSCTGTVTFTGEAGQIGQAAFEMQGNYLDPLEEPAPLDAIFEETIPPQVELAQLSISGDSDFCAQSFTYVLGNQINLKECMNAADGFDGSQITDREPTAQMNPEATYEAYTGMWNNFSKSTQFPIHTRVGSVEGNMVRFYADRVNFTGLTYGDRNGAVSMEAGFQLNGLSNAGDDELRVVFS